MGVRPTKNGTWTALTPMNRTEYRGKSLGTFEQHRRAELAVLLYLHWRTMYHPRKIPLQNRTIDAI